MSSLRDKQREDWTRVDPELRELCLRHLRGDDGFNSVADEVRSSISADPEEWILPYHFGWGMGMRNFLRDVVKDAQLPDVDGHGGNWDDYYVPCIEEALGVWSAEFDGLARDLERELNYGRD